MQEMRLIELLEKSISGVPLALGVSLVCLTVLEVKPGDVVCGTVCDALIQPGQSYLS